MTLDYRPPDHPAAPTTTQADRRVGLVLLLSALLVYAYFFAGEGYNQNAHIDTMRALVEHGNFEITPYAQGGGPMQYTGDVYVIDGRRYSNKPPGLALVGAPVYAVARGIERAMGVDVRGDRVLTLNAYLVTLWVGALPGALVVVAMFHHLRASAFDQRLAATASAALAFGSLLMPYATIAMGHNLLAACLFLPWVWVVRPRPSALGAVVAGLAVAIGILTFLPAAPLAAIYVIELLRRHRIGAAAAFTLGPVLAVAFMLTYNAHHYGSPFETGARIGGEQYYEPHLFLGYFDWPQWQRLYWITVHHYRGLFYYCPMFILCLLALIKPDGAWLRRNVMPALVVAWAVLFYLTFNGWPGGWSAGVRYAVPALPFLWLFAVPAIARYRTLAGWLIGVSAFNMFAITAYNVMFPGSSFGPPLDDNPVAECVKRLSMNWIARNVGSWNWGMLIGIKGALSALPAAAMVGAVFYLVRRFTRPGGQASSAEAGKTSAATPR